MKDQVRKNSRRGGRRLLFGDFVAAVCDACGRQGPRTVQWAVNERIVRFSAGQQVVIS